MAAIQTALLYTILNINSNIKRTYLIQEGYVTSMLMYTTLSRFQNFSDSTSFSRHNCSGICAFRSEEGIHRASSQRCRTTVRVG